MIQAILSRFRFISLCVLSSFVLLTDPVIAAKKTPRGDRPNIIFILVDDMRSDQLGLTGHPFAKTPNIDRIGEEGVVFDNAFVTTPLCSPSRASFLTGQYPHKHRIINNDRNGLGFISHKLVTFPQVLRRVGYETAFIGKWHMGHDDTRRPGFDHWTSFVGQGLFLDPVVNRDGIRKQYDGYMTDLLNEWAVEFVEEEREKPFLLFLSHKAVHRPFIPADRHKNLYADAEYNLPDSATDDLSGKPAITREVPPVEIFRIPEATAEPAEPRYGRGEDDRSIHLDHVRCLASVDDGVGMLFETLERIGKLENTLVIFSSDNGYLFGEHGLYNNKRVPYEESLRVPLLMRYPRRIDPGSKRDDLVLNIDIAPTLYDLVDAEPPIDVHGKTLLPILDDPDRPFRTEFLAEYFLERVTPAYPEWRAVRTERWKYVHYPNLEGMDELYDLALDPTEVDNRIDSPDARPVVREMRERLIDLYRKNDAPAGWSR